jgi:hypothetical protein
VTEERTTVGRRDLWAVVKTSAERRFGKPLLAAFLALALAGIVVVAISVSVRHF